MIDALRVSQAIDVISNRRLEARCQPACSVHLLLLGQPSVSSVISPSHIQQEFMCRLEQLDTNGRRYRVWLTNKSALQLRDSIKELVIDAMLQSRIARNERQAHEIFDRVVNTRHLRENPDADDRFKMFSNGLARNSIVQALAHAVNPFCYTGLIPTLVCAGIVKGMDYDNKEDREHIDNSLKVLRWHSSRTLQGKVIAYDEVVKPYLQLYVKIDDVLSHRAGICMKWTVTGTFAHGFEEISPIVPEDHLDRAFDCVQRMNAVIKNTTNDSYTTYNNIGNIYSMFLSSIRHLDLVQTVQFAIDNRISVNEVLRTIAQSRVDVSGTDWELITVSHMKLIALAIMKSALYGAGSNPSQPVYFLNFQSKPNCANSMKNVLIYERENAMKLCETVKGILRQDIHRICGAEVEQSLDFANVDLTSVDNYLCQQEREYQDSERRLTDALFAFTAALVEAPDAHGQERTSSRSSVLQMLSQLERVATNLVGNNLVIDVTGQIIRIALDVVQRKGDVIRSTLDASNNFRECRNKYKMLEISRHLMNLYRYIHDTLRNPAVAAICVHTSGQGSAPNSGQIVTVTHMDPVVIEY